MPQGIYDTPGNGVILCKERLTVAPLEDLPQRRAFPGADQLLQVDEPGPVDPPDLEPVFCHCRAFHIGRQSFVQPQRNAHQCVFGRWKGAPGHRWHEEPNCLIYELMGTLMQQGTRRATSKVFGIGEMNRSRRNRGVQTRSDTCGQAKAPGHGIVLLSRSIGINGEAGKRHIPVSQYFPVPRKSPLHEFADVHGYVRAGVGAHGVIGSLVDKRLRPSPLGPSLDPAGF